MKAYYNEFDAEAADWLRENIAAGIIAPGDVDERSIADVRADDLKGYCQCHFFAGVGGWSLALRYAGWPDDRPVWTGSCPCQPFSSAGKGKGAADERHLWPEFARLIRECRPASVYGEQVASAIGHGWLDGVFADLEAEGYACGAIVLGAHSVGAPHIRQRLYWHGRLPESCGPDGERGTRGLSAAQDGVGCSRELDGHLLERPEHGGETGGLPDAERQRAGAGVSGVEGHEELGRDRPAIGGDAGGLEQQQQGLEGHAGHGDGGREPGRVAAEAGRHAATSGSDGAEWACQPDGQGRDARQSATSIERHGHTAGPDVSDGFWSRYSILPYRDGKSRRVESEPVGLADGYAMEVASLRAAGLSEEEAAEIFSTFPLARNFPGRRMLLKGYGNAIVPQVAAAFIRATH